MRLPILHWTLVLAALVGVTSTYAIKGPQGGVNVDTGERPVRRDFAEFVHAGPAFDLYILSLRAFAQQNQTSLLSYYQVAGIHGHPFISWDGVQGQYNLGYCTHGSVLFPIWHRPYMALFEQILWDSAQQIASTYPDSQRAEYQAAAQTFRMPYWDWASNATIPDTINKPIISINTATGPQTVVNPLYNYTFHPQPSAADFPPSDALAKYTSTVRCPNAAGQSQPSVANGKLEALAAQLRSMTYQLIAQTSIYAPFSNTAYSDGRGGRYNSIENMHNAIHLLVGGQGGHMSNIPYSAFDPIFWLHHTNVDRLFAIWQAIYPSSYVTPQANSIGTYTDAPGGTEDINSALTPFHSDTMNDLYTPPTARSTRSFGYTYPELIDWGINATQLAANTRTALNQLYNPVGNISRWSARKASRRQAYDPTSVHADHQYFANIKLDSSEITEPLWVHVFIGEIPASPPSWATAGSLAGSFAAMAHTDGMMVGQIALSHRLTDLGVDLKPNHTVPYLGAQLGYRMQRLDDSPLNGDEIPASLKLAVVGQQVVSSGADDRFPHYGPFVEYPAATEGLVGGLQKGEKM